MKIFKLTMRLYVCQIILAITTLIFIAPLYKMTQNNPRLFSLITGLVYLMVMYSAVWRAGRADSRKIPGYYPDKKLPLWLSLTTLVVPLILFIIRFAFPDIWKLDFPFLEGTYDFFVSGCKVYGTPDMIYRAWYFPFVALIPDSNWVAYLLVMFILPIIIFVGYNVGLTRFSVTEYVYSKLVFKKKETSDKK